jgi:hypothetical protein
MFSIVYETVADLYPLHHASTTSAISRIRSWMTDPYNLLPSILQLNI